MNTSEWLNKCKLHREELRSIVGNWYPYRIEKSDMIITAPLAESACNVVRNQIIEDTKSILLEPEIRFDAALLDNNAGELHSLMQATWFGIPESTSCWSLHGFRPLVDLLDDPPEDDL
jgi:hypothetical protein